MTVIDIINQLDVYKKEGRYQEFEHFIMNLDLDDLNRLQSFSHILYECSTNILMKK